MIEQICDVTLQFPQSERVTEIRVPRGASDMAILPAFLLGVVLMEETPTQDVRGQRDQCGHSVCRRLGALEDIAPPQAKRTPGAGAEHEQDDGVFAYRRKERWYGKPWVDESALRGELDHGTETTGVISIAGRGQMRASLRRVRGRRTSVDRKRADKRQYVGMKRFERVPVVRGRPRWKPVFDLPGQLRKVFGVGVMLRRNAQVRGAARPAPAPPIRTNVLLVARAFASCRLSACRSGVLSIEQTAYGAGEH